MISRLFSESRLPVAIAVYETIIAVLTIQGTARRVVTIMIYAKF